MNLTEQRFKRVVTPGMIDLGWGGRSARLFVEIEHHFDRNQKWELLIMGVEGPTRSGNAAGSCGQCVDSLSRITKIDPAWSAAKIANLRDIWNRWHLNGMKAGSPDQARYLREHPYDRERDGDHYDWARRTLAAVGLHPDPNYAHPTKTVDHVTVSAARGVVHTAVPQPYVEYGAAWLYEPVPAEVLSWLYNLPKAVRDHPWGDHDVFGPDMPEGWES